MSLFFTATMVGSAAGYGYGSTMASSSLGWGWGYFIEAMCMAPPAVFFFFLTPPVAMKGTRDSQLMGEEEEEEERSMCGELGLVLQTPLFVLVVMGYAANIAVVMGFATFGPVFLQALGFFHSDDSASLCFSSAVVFAGVVGTPLGGLGSDWLSGERASGYKKRGACLKVMIGTALLAVLCFGLILFLNRNKWGWVAVFSMGTMFLMSSAPCITKACLHTVPVSARASALGLMNLLIHAFGDVPSPIALGYLKDKWAPNCGYRRVNETDVLDPKCHLDKAGLNWVFFVVVIYLILPVVFWGAAYGIHRGAKDEEAGAEYGEGLLDEVEAAWQATASSDGQKWEQLA